MGWTFLYGNGSHREIDQERNQDSPNSPWKVKECTLVNFSHHWSILENATTGERAITLDLIERRPHETQWGYKDLDESCHPYTYDCPLSYLEKVSMVANEGWRVSVRYYWEKRAERTAKAKAWRKTRVRA